MSVTRLKSTLLKTLDKLKFVIINEPKNFFKAISDGFFIVVSGILLITPGFATDLFGLILFLKPIRNFIIKIFQKKIKSSKFSLFNEHN